jgi:hypothetical protein
MPAVASDQQVFSTEERMRCMECGVGARWADQQDRGWCSSHVPANGQPLRRLPEPAQLDLPIVGEHEVVDIADELEGRLPAISDLYSRDVIRRAVDELRKRVKCGGAA